MSIKIEKLSYIYNPKSPFEKAALKDISLTIEDGDFFGIIGHTGSGKSTLVSHLNGLIKLTSGKITVGDTDLSQKYNHKKLRAKVGMVFQYPEYQLFADTVIKDVGFGPKNIGISDSEISVRVKEAIELVGLDYNEIGERSPFEISGGQMRRVALAGVLSMNPEVLILDEPTAGLDPKGKKEVMTLLMRIKEQRCPTMIMISHNMDEISAYCNKIAVLSHGTLRGVFTPSELFRESALVEELKLELPTTSKIAGALNSKGWDIDKGILTEDELADAIAAYLRKQRKENNSAGEVGKNA